MEANRLPDFVKIEIYLITNIHPDAGGKTYVGQTQSHVLNRGKYRPYGRDRRWAAHVSEAKANGNKQSRKLNNAIRKYGPESFSVELLTQCELEDADFYEEFFIDIYHSITDGYNILTGGAQARPSEEQRKNISTSLKDYYSNKDVCERHSKSHVEYYDKAKVDKYNEIEVISITLGIYSNGLVHMLVETPLIGPRDRITFRGKHVTRENAAQRAVNVAMEIVKGDTEKIQIPERFAEVFQLP